MALITDVVVAFRDTSKHLLKSADRTHEISLYRSEVFWLADKLLSLSAREIGQSFSGRDPSTVSHGIQRVNDLIADDAVYAAQIAELRWLAEIELCSLNADPSGNGFDEQARAIARSVIASPVLEPFNTPHDLQRLARAYLKQSVRLAMYENFAGKLTDHLEKLKQG